MLIATTAICTISALVPPVGIYLFAFSIAILGVFLIGHGSRTDNAAFVNIGILVFAVGWFLGALFLALLARVLDV